MAQKLSQKVARKIKRCKDKQETFLNLRECKLTEIPAEVFELTHLEILDLGNYKETRSNLVTSIPPEIGRLTNLRHLDLTYNKVSYIAYELGNLSNLKTLNLAYNKLTVIPEFLGNLINLSALHLTNNPLSGLPPTLKHLTKLTRLKLNYCALKEFPAFIVSLKHLIYLDLNNNFIEEIPQEITQLKKLEDIFLINNRLEQVSKEVFFLPQLKNINLQKNPLNKPPIEIVNQGLPALKNYFKTLDQTSDRSLTESTTSDFLNEVKLLLVGEGRVGKTSLAKALSIPNYQFSDQHSTEGININQWLIPKEEFEGKLPLTKDFRLNVWDFGGQEIYHATHQFFLTRRSIYLFVTESRKEDSHDTFFYWLNIIKLLGDASPVILVLNKIDQPTKELASTDYKMAFPNIVEFKKVSCHPDYKDTIVSLKQEIKRIILNKNLLPQIGTSLPKVWVTIRQDIENLQRADKNHISYDEYLDICQKHALNEEQATYLSRFFHDLGVFLHFNDDLELTETVFLNHEWVTKGVYQVLDNQKIKDQQGKFTDQDLMEIWKERKYRAKRRELLALMKNRKFELCFSIGQGAYLAPQLLPANPVDFTLPSDGNQLYFEYSYQFMPKGILTRFIVKRNADIYQNLYWLYGVVLYYEETYALVREAYFNKKITIRIVGKHTKELLSIIRKTIQEIHADFHSLEVEEMIPCNCQECKTSQTPYLYKFEALKRRLNKGRNQVECDQSFENVKIANLLDGIGGSRSTTLESIQHFITKDQLNNALDAMQGYAKNMDDWEIEKTVITLKATCKANEKAYASLQIGNETYTNQRNRIIGQILDIIQAN